jgi:hypothetical protein
VQTAGNGGSALLIFVPRAAHSHDVSENVDVTQATAWPAKPQTEIPPLPTEVFA